jgi:hypothetical protein
MAITSAICNSFKVEILTGVHNFTASTGDTFNLALYTSSATLDKDTTVYITLNEVATATGYTFCKRKRTYKCDTCFINGYSCL